LRLDGARLDQILRILILPLAAPALSTATLFALLLACDEFFYALLFTAEQRAKTVTIAIADIAAGRSRTTG